MCGKGLALTSGNMLDVCKACMTSCRPLLLGNRVTGNINLDMKESTRNQYVKDEWHMRTALRDAVPDRAMTHLAHFYLGSSS